MDGDARPDLVKALATLSNPDPKLATFSLSADSGVYLNTGSGFRAAKSSLHVLPSFAGQNGRIPFSLAWQDAYSSRTTGLEVLDVTGDGRADLVGGVRDLDRDAAASGASTACPPGTRVRRMASSQRAIVGDVLDDGLWGMNRSGIVDLTFFTTPTRGTNSGNARFADLDGDGLPELIVRGVEYRRTASWRSHSAVRRVRLDLHRRATHQLLLREPRASCTSNARPSIDSAGRSASRR